MSLYTEDEQVDDWGDTELQITINGDCVPGVPNSREVLENVLRDVLHRLNDSYEGYIVWRGEVEE